ncbi:MAG: tryptophan--tRNA ligase [Lentisphaeria bacterium]|nr:tryptophan--tRNA ligase [Lentisphaeria bacterium]
MRILSGIQPSGNLHLGNYFGAMRPCIELQDKGDVFLFIANYHALTSHPEPELLRERVRGVAVDFLACGIDPEKTVFFKQTDLMEVCELTWILACQTTVGQLERCHSYKDKIAQGLTPNHGLFTYPVLMAADILLYQSNVVPVGKDQKQHLEVTRDLANRFNNNFGETFVMPEPHIQENVAVVPGIDGRKMSKSYENIIELFGGKKQTRKKFMKIVTDSTSLEDPKDPDSCNVFALYSLFANDEELAQMRQNYQGGNYGFGHAKQAAFEKFWDYFEPMREKREYYIQNPDIVDDILADGARRAKVVADETMEKVRIAVGLK